MIIVGSAHLPLGQVVPMMVQLIPFSDDFDEHKTVFACLQSLFQHDFEQHAAALPAFLSAAHSVCTTPDQFDDGESSYIGAFVNSVIL